MLAINLVISKKPEEEIILNIALFSGANNSSVFEIRTSFSPFRFLVFYFEAFLLGIYK